MGWAEGLILWALFGIGALYVFAEIASRFGTTDQEDDWLARRKRTLERNGYKSKMGVK